MIRAKSNIRHNGVTFKKGALIKGLNTAEEKRLITLNSAEYVISPDEELQQQQVEETITVDPEKFEELATDLNELFNADELKKAALDVGVDLTGISKKADIIAAIINQGKADELLEDDIEGEQNE